MAQPTSKSKRRPARRRADDTLVRVLATQRAPTEPVSIGTLSTTQPYITDAWVTHQLGIDSAANSGLTPNDQFALGERMAALPPSQELRAC